MSGDPYAVLGVRPDVSDRELRTAYRRLVQQHHPDHNGGSVESARRFEQIQLAYGAIREQRRGAASTRGTSSTRGTESPRASTPPPRSTPPSDLDERLAAMEFELREAQRKREQELREAKQARDRAAAQAREAARNSIPDRPSDEELGYYSTDDSLGQILADARDELADRFSHAREHPVVKQVSDLIDGLDDLASQADRRKPGT